MNLITYQKIKLVLQRIVSSDSVVRELPKSCRHRLLVHIQTRYTNRKCFWAKVKDIPFLSFGIKNFPKTVQDFSKSKKNRLECA